MNDLKKVAETISRAPRVGDSIVWRLKDDKQWRIGNVCALLGGYQIVELLDGFRIDRVSLSEIEWHLK